MRFFGVGVLLTVLVAVHYIEAESIPSRFRKNDYYPRKGEGNYRKSEVKSSGAIRDIIRRNSPRYRKVLVRNTNGDITFSNEDCRYMTSRAKSKLDILGSLVQSRIRGQRLQVLKAWTDKVDPNDYSSLHYEGLCFVILLSLVSCCSANFKFRVVLLNSFVFLLTLLDIMF